MASRRATRRGSAKIIKAEFSHPAIGADLADLLHYIGTGPGLVAVRGFPGDKYTSPKMPTLYWRHGSKKGR